MNVSGATIVAAVLGDPIAHSLSPILHNAGYRALGLDYVYVAHRVPITDAAAALDGVRAMGMAGVNVTMPLKGAALRQADRSSGDATAVGAANTILVEAGQLVAHNTDVEGFLRAAADAGIGFSGAAVAVVGAGGAARAVVVGVSRAGSERISVLARKQEPARSAASLAPGSRAVPIGSAAAAAIVRKADVVVNATPLGMTAVDLPPHLLEGLGAGHTVIDLVYVPPETAFLHTARSAGARGVGGLGMLVHQAGLSFTLFTGQQAPLEAMSAAAVAALAHSREPL